MATKKKTKKLAKKKSSGLMKFLEAAVVLGAVAGVLIKFFKGEQKKK